MKTATLSEWGLDELHIVDADPPTAGPHDVIVRLRSLSINYRDLLVVQGTYNPRQPLPLVPGSDGAGEVVEVGAAVSRFEIGDRVIPTFFQDWVAGEPTSERLKSSLGSPVDGTFRELYCAHEDAFVRTPDHLSDDEAATLGCAALTAWSALVTQGNVKAGDDVLVLGTGGVSMFALQFAKQCGARVIATSGSPDKIERLHDEFGVEHVVNYREDPRWGRTVRALTDGRGVDHVVEVGGAGTLRQSIAAVRPGGTVSLIGVLADGETPSLVPVLMQNIRIQGVIVGPRESFEEMNRAITRAELHPVVDEKSFSFNELRDAFEYMRAGEHMGKISIRV